MQVTVEAVAREGHGFKDATGWRNADKKAGIDFKQLHPGDVIDITENSAKFITAYKLVTAAPEKPAKAAWTGGGFKKDDPERSMKQARGAAVKAVLESPFVYDHIKNMSEEQGLNHILKVSEKIASYIEKGSI